MKLGFIGAGAITEAIVTGLLAGDFQATEIILSERNRAVSGRLAEMSPKVSVRSDNQAIVDAVDLVFLAVRPQNAEAVLRPLQFRTGQQVASLVATVTAEALHGWIGPNVDIFRAIPLPAVARRQGVTAIYPNCELGEKIFSPLGRVVSAESLDEFDAYAAASALMGTYFSILDTAAGWLCAQGTNHLDAQAYLNGVFLGLAETTAAADGMSFAALREAHSTPKGLNEQMTSVFAGAGGDKALLAGLDSVAARIRNRRT